MGQILKWVLSTVPGTGAISDRNGLLFMPDRGHMNILFPRHPSSCSLKPGSWGLGAGAGIWNSDASSVRTKFPTTLGLGKMNPLDGENIADRPDVPKPIWGRCTSTWLALRSTLHLREGSASCVFSCLPEQPGQETAATGEGEGPVVSLGAPSVGRAGRARPAFFF